MPKGKFQCEKAWECLRHNCPHRIPHDLKTEPDNDCLSGCDVDGGYEGSQCFEREIQT